MNVRNRRVIRHLSWQSFKASGRRNLIAICAIALTAILFTALFTVFLSVTKSYEQYQMRQRGGYAEGTFKDVTDEQLDALRKNGRAKALGERVVVGSCTDGVFGKVPAEVGFMDANTEKWSYITYAEGRAPEKADEIAMDEKALDLLGVKPQLGEKITLTYTVTDIDNIYETRTDTFVLCGWWNYDTLSPAHYINVSQAYAKQIRSDYQQEGADFRTDVSVMFPTSFGIEQNMQKMAEDIGCQTVDEKRADYLSCGVNPGYVLAGTESTADLQMWLAVAAFLALILFTGYLIIYNIFQISVSGDVRYYGLLKTIGVTPRQLRRMVRQQAGILCLFGCPAGLLAGYGLGNILLPRVLSITGIPISAEVSTSPVIFVSAAVFSVLTVLVSCHKPARMAAKVSPIEAAKYTENTVRKRRKRKTRGASVGQMAVANLGRNKAKTALVIVSLSLAVVLLSVLFSFIRGFDMQKYLDRQSCADFIVGTTKYFRYEGYDSSAALPQDVVQSVQNQTTAETSGQAWYLPTNPVEWVSQERIGQWVVDIMARDQENHPGLYGCDMQVEGMDPDLLGKLQVLDGDLSALTDTAKHAVAVVVQTDDYGNIVQPGNDENAGDLSDYPKVGDTIRLTYVDEAEYVDSSTGEEVDPATAGGNAEYHITRGTDQTYTVAALVLLPYSISARYTIPSGDQIVMSSDQLRSDSGQTLKSLLYAFDTPNAEAEAEAEQVLSRMTQSDTSGIMYQSKASLRREFTNFRNMFLVVGLVLCVIVGVIGILNYFNAVLTGILSRRREFAVLQAIGMTRKQLRQMLIAEGTGYAVGAILLSTVLTILLCPLVGSLLEQIFFFYQYHFTLAAVGIAAPVFLLLGIVLPLALFVKSA